MLPRVLVTTASAGDWVVFTDGVPAEWPRHLSPGSLRRVTSKLAFGRLAR
jgi:hypothetical protein